MDYLVVGNCAQEGDLFMVVDATNSRAALRKAAKLQGRVIMQRDKRDYFVFVQTTAEQLNKDLDIYDLIPRTFWRVQVVAVEKNRRIYPRDDQV